MSEEAPQLITGIPDHLKSEVNHAKEASAENQGESTPDIAIGSEVFVERNKRDENGKIIRDENGHALKELDSSKWVVEEFLDDSGEVVVTTTDEQGRTLVKELSLSKLEDLQKQVQQEAEAKAARSLVNIEEESNSEAKRKEVAEDLGEPALELVGIDSPDEQDSDDLLAPPENQEPISEELRQALLRFQPGDKVFVERNQYDHNGNKVRDENGNVKKSVDTQQWEVVSIDYDKRRVELKSLDDKLSKVISAAELSELQDRVAQAEQEDTEEQRLSRDLGKARAELEEAYAEHRRIVSEYGDKSYEAGLAEGHIRNAKDNANFYANKLLKLRGY